MTINANQKAMMTHPTTPPSQPSLSVSPPLSLQPHTPPAPKPSVEPPPRGHVEGGRVTKSQRQNHAASRDRLHAHADSTSGSGLGSDCRASSTVSSSSSWSRATADVLIASDPFSRKLDLESRHEDLARERALVPGSDAWAEPESRLFEVLFMRECIALLPSHWSVDFRGIPTPALLFAADESDKPVIYAHSGNDSQAANALLRLIDLTGSVRVLVQSGGWGKVSSAVRTELDRYLWWASRDGGYNRADIVPALVLDIVDPSLDGDGAMLYMQTRMLDLAAQHRDLLLRRLAEPKPEGGELAPDVHRRVPPVVFGLFIIHSTVFVLSVDASKGPGALVTYHVEVDFNAPHQGLWNGITIAIPICMARDEMAVWKDESCLVPDHDDSDPDA